MVVVVEDQLLRHRRLDLVRRDPLRDGHTLGSIPLRRHARWARRHSWAGRRAVERGRGGPAVGSSGGAGSQALGAEHARRDEPLRVVGETVPRPVFST